jgi:hypothetical protein
MEDISIRDIGSDDTFHMNDITKDFELTSEEIEKLESIIDTKPIEDLASDKPEVMNNGGAISFKGGCSAGCAGTCSGCCSATCADSCYNRCLGSYSH